MVKKGFTLAEVLITLAIIGVVAAIAIPSVISNSQQQEFKTGLRKAVSVLNSAITMNMAIDGESPYDNNDLYNFLQKHMSVLKSGRMPYYSAYVSNGNTVTSGGKNYAFYTSDGFRFEFYDIENTRNHLKLHESDVAACLASYNVNQSSFCGGCGSYGLASNPNGTTKPPCAILVDVNGDRKPSPSNIECIYGHEIDFKACAYKVIPPNSKLISDIFSIIITEDRAIPYGVTAQKAMYQAQK